MRRFKCYVNHGYAGVPDEEEVIEFPDDATDEEIDNACVAAVEVMLSNLDSGYYEIKEEAA